MKKQILLKNQKELYIYRQINNVNKNSYIDSVINLNKLLYSYYNGNQFNIITLQRYFFT